MKTAAGPRTRNGAARRAAASAPERPQRRPGRATRGRRRDDGHHEPRGEVAAQPEPDQHDEEEQRARRVAGHVRRPVVRRQSSGIRSTNSSSIARDVVDRAGGLAGTRSRLPSTREIPSGRRRTRAPAARPARRRTTTSSRRRQASARPGRRRTASRAGRCATAGSGAEPDAAGPRSRVQRREGAVRSDAGAHVPAGQRGTARRRPPAGRQRRGPTDGATPRPERGGRGGRHVADARCRNVPWLGASDRRQRFVRVAGPPTALRFLRVEDMEPTATWSSRAATRRPRCDLLPRSPEPASR